MKKYLGNLSNAVPLTQYGVFKKPRIVHVLFGRCITDSARETCKLTLLLFFRGEKTFYFTSPWIFKRSTFHHISLNCPVKPSSHGQGLIVEQGKGSWNVNRYQVIQKSPTHMPSYYAFSLFFLKKTLRIFKL